MEPKGKKERMELIVWSRVDSRTSWDRYPLFLSPYLPQLQFQSVYLEMDTHCTEAMRL